MSNSLRRRLTLCTLLLLCGTAMGQEKYSFVRYDLNRLHYDSNAVSMQVFLQRWSQMVSTGQGTVSIVHIGGSHVQAGTFPHRVRTNLLQAYPTLVGGRGLVFPYSAAAKCNNPNDYRVHCKERVILTRSVHKSPDYRLGLSGMAVTAQDVPTRIQMLSAEPRFDFATSRIEVLGYSGDGVVPRLSYDDREVMPSYVDEESHRYVFNLRHTVDSFELYLPCGHGQSFTLTGVVLGNRNAGITYHSLGVNGAALPDVLRCPDLTSDLRLVRPDLVIFGIGINDAHGKNFDTVAFKNNYLRLCDSIRSVNPQCAFIFITNNDSYFRTGRRRYSVNHNGLLARETAYRLAAITGGAVWDQFEVMGGLKSMEKWQKAGLAQRDKVHFTRAGYTLLGDLLFEALDRELRSDHRPVAAPRCDNVNTLTPTRAKNDTSAKQSKSPARAKDTAKTKDTTPVRTTVKDSTPAEKPLPRGLRRKSRTKPATNDQRPATNDQRSTTNIPANSRDRFPYISY